LKRLGNAKDREPLLLLPSLPSLPPSFETLPDEGVDLGGLNSLPSLPPSLRPSLPPTTNNLILTPPSLPPLLPPFLPDEGVDLGGLDVVKLLDGGLGREGGREGGSGLVVCGGEGEREGARREGGQ